MSKRNAFRLGPDPHSAESVAFTVNRYGAIKAETLKEITDWLETPAAKAERVYRVEHHTISDLSEGDIVTFPVIVTNRIGSPIEKFIDNEHDAQNTLANIRNKDFPANKQGS